MPKIYVKDSFFKKRFTFISLVLYYLLKTDHIHPLFQPFSYLLPLSYLSNHCGRGGGKTVKDWGNGWIQGRFTQTQQWSYSYKLTVIMITGTSLVQAQPRSNLNGFKTCFFFSSFLCLSLAFLSVLHLLPNVQPTFNSGTV